MWSGARLCAVVVRLLLSVQNLRFAINAIKQKIAFIQGVNVGSKYTYNKTVDVISDTGTSLIIGPKKVAK